WIQFGVLKSNHIDGPLPNIGSNDLLEVSRTSFRPHRILNRGRQGAELTAGRNQRLVIRRLTELPAFVWVVAGATGTKSKRNRYTPQPIRFHNPSKKMDGSAYRPPRPCSASPSTVVFPALRHYFAWPVRKNGPILSDPH